MLVTTTLLDGQEHVILHVYMRSDGAELVDTILLDPTDLNPPCKRLAVEQILYDFAGFDARIEFDSGLVEQTLIWVLPEGSGSGYRDFKPFGNFVDRSGLDGLGNLLITTTGFTAVGIDQGSMILRVKKNVRQILPV